MGLVWYLTTHCLVPIWSLFTGWCSLLVFRLWNSWLRCNSQFGFLGDRTSQNTEPLRFRRPSQLCSPPQLIFSSQLLSGHSSSLNLIGDPRHKALTLVSDCEKTPPDTYMKGASHVSRLCDTFLGEPKESTFHPVEIIQASGKNTYTHSTCCF